MRYKIKIALLAFCSLFLGCKTSILASKKPVLKIEQQACMGGCPQYKAEFYQDGRIVYQAIAYMPVIGNHTYIIDKRVIAALLEQGRKIRFHKFAKNYPIPPDYPISLITLMLDRKIHTVSLGPNAPATLQDFKKNIHTQILSILVEQPPYKP